MQGAWAAWIGRRAQPAAATPGVLAALRLYTCAPSLLAKSWLCEPA